LKEIRKTIIVKPTGQHRLKYMNHYPACINLHWPALTCTDPNWPATCSLDQPAPTCNLHWPATCSLNPPKLLFMIISHVKIIAFQLSLFCKNYRFSKTVLYIINRKIHGWLEIPDLFLVLNMTSHLFAALTCEISCSTVEINLVFPRTHVLLSI
jgi:hypothetical protein